MEPDKILSPCPQTQPAETNMHEMKISAGRNQKHGPGLAVRKFLFACRNTCLRILDFNWVCALHLN
jgi:hypothetical protein